MMAIILSARFRSRFVLPIVFDRRSAYLWQSTALNARDCSEFAQES
jgi:hypothetical protein